jgi:carbamoyl-phosphate synthase small subunit
VAGAFLALADGSIWEGEPFGAIGRRTGEAVFNTGMTGYQEVLTDPSYCRQIVVATAPHIGNTGVAAEDDESSRVWVAGLVVRALCARPSSWRAVLPLSEYLAACGVPGITGVDCRSVVRHLRDNGAQHGAIVSDGADAATALELARGAPDINKMDLVGEVTCRVPYIWNRPAAEEWYPRETGGPQAAQMALPEPPGTSLLPHIVVLDVGVKNNTLRLLARRGCRVTVVPARTSARDILDLSPDGVLLSNGPGDPAELGDIVAVVRDLVGTVPMFGICLGHQLLGLALGGTTYKLKFGHRGSNQPVRDASGSVQISTHNHGYALAAEGLPADVSISHRNLNDGCVEGLAAPERLAWSVQYHPEAAPGPHDALELFDDFLARVALRPRAAGFALSIGF